MSPSPSSKQKCLTYPEAVRAFGDANFREDLNDACGRLGQQLTAIVERFDAMSKEMHSIDVQKLAAPLKPRWEALAKDFGELLWQYRSNAGYISGRLRLFCDSVLPVASRNVGARSQRSYQETVHILQSFMTISAEHAAITRSIVERAMSLSQQMVGFHTDIAKLVSRRQSSPVRKEVYDLAMKLSELEGSIRQISSLVSQIQNDAVRTALKDSQNSNLPRSDVTHVAVSAFRIATSCGPKPPRSKIPQKRMVMTEDLSQLTQAYNGLEVKRNEFAHAQYTVQIRLQQSDYLEITQTKIASLASDAMLSIESALSLSLSIWARLKTDCGSIAQWMSATTPTDPPPVLSEYHECGPALYATLSFALNSCVSSIDPSKLKPTTGS